MEIFRLTGQLRHRPVTVKRYLSATLGGFINTASLRRAFADNARNARKLVLLYTLQIPYSCKYTEIFKAVKNENFIRKYLIFFLFLL